MALRPSSSAWAPPHQQGSTITIIKGSSNHQVHQLDHGLHHKVLWLKAINNSYIINNHHQAISIMYVIMSSRYVISINVHHVIKARHVNSNMAPRPSSSAWAPSSNRSSIMTLRNHQVIANKAPPSSSSKDQAIIKYIDWTMGSTIKCNGSKPSPRTTSSIIIKTSISIIWAPPHHHQRHGIIISSPRLHEHHLQASIWLHHVVTTARVTIT